MYKGFKGTTYKQRLARAKKLMEKAGFSDKNPLKLTLSINKDPAIKETAIAVANFWKQIHVETELFAQDTAIHFQDVLSAKHEIARDDWKGDYNDPTTFLALFVRGNTMNGTQTGLAAYDKLFHDSFTQGKIKRAQSLRTAEQMILDLGYVIPINYHVIGELHSPVITNFETNIQGDYILRLLKISRK